MFLYWQLLPEKLFLVGWLCVCMCVCLCAHARARTHTYIYNWLGQITINYLRTCLYISHIPIFYVCVYSFIPTLSCIYLQYFSLIMLVPKYIRREQCANTHFLRDYSFRVRVKIMHFTIFFFGNVNLDSNMFSRVIKQLNQYFQKNFQQYRLGIP